MNPGVVNGGKQSGRIVTRCDEIEEGPLDQVAEQVRERYWSAWSPGPLAPLGNRGGFSGARLWRCQGVAGHLCLRAWPPSKTAAWVRRLHGLMESARRQGLAFVPAVYATDNGDTVVEAAGRVWELTQWLEGRASFAEAPSATRLEAACEALARLHRAWETFTAPAEPCPAVRRRLRLLADWQALVSAGWRPQAPPMSQLDPLWPIAERAWRGLPRWLPEVPRCLGPWSNFCCPVQPCLCDPWHDNLLFEGDRLTGLVDYGTVKNDHVAVDVARLLGSLVGDAPEGWERGLGAYRRVRGLSRDEEQLARVLDRTGVILGVVNWLRWLYYEGRPYEDVSAVAQRLESLVKRTESWQLSVSRDPKGSANALSVS
jgi:Ser/Thr protein kinase RdoA (MazF antagonist)